MGRRTAIIAAPRDLARPYSLLDDAPANGLCNSRNPVSCTKLCRRAAKLRRNGCGRERHDLGDLFAGHPCRCMAQALDLAQRQLSPAIQTGPQFAREVTVEGGCHEAQIIGFVRVERLVARKSNRTTEPLEMKYRNRKGNRNAKTSHNSEEFVSFFEVSRAFDDLGGAHRRALFQQSGLHRIVQKPFIVGNDG